MDTPRFNSWEGQKDEFQDYVNKFVNQSFEIKSIIKDINLF